MVQYNYFVYITTNPGKTTLYTGVTNALDQRIAEHYLNRGIPKTFAGKYYCYLLIYYERYQYIHEAIAREKEIKGWNRGKKLQLISSVNPYFNALNKDILSDWPPKNVAPRNE